MARRGSGVGFTAPLVCERASVRKLVLVNAMINTPGETPGAWWAHTGALEAQAEAARAGGYGPFDLETYFLHDVDAGLAAEGEGEISAPSPRSPLDRCVTSRRGPKRTRVLAGEDDRFFPVGFQRRVARDLLGVEADVLPGGHLLALVQPRLVAEYLQQTTGRP